jgi:hypothetical protein
VDFDLFEIIGTGPDRREAMCNGDKCGAAAADYTAGAEAVVCVGTKQFQAWLGGSADQEELPLDTVGFEDEWTRLAVNVPETYSSATLHLSATLGGYPWLIDACEISSDGGDSEALPLDCSESGPAEPSLQWKMVDGSNGPSERKHAVTWVSEDALGSEHITLFGGCDASMPNCVDSTGQGGAFAVTQNLHAIR